MNAIFSECMNTYILFNLIELHVDNISDYTI